MNGQLLSFDKVREQLHEIRGLIHPFVDSAKVMNRCTECNIDLMGVQKNILNRRYWNLFITSMNNSKSVLDVKSVLGGVITAGMAELIRETMEHADMS